MQGKTPSQSPCLHHSSLLYTADCCSDINPQKIYLLFFCSLSIDALTIYFCFFVCLLFLIGFCVYLCNCCTIFQHLHWPWNLLQHWYTCYTTTIYWYHSTKTLNTQSATMKYLHSNKECNVLMMKTIPLSKMRIFCILCIRLHHHGLGSTI